MNKVYIHPKYSLEELMELRKQELFDDPNFRSRAKAVYQEELQPKSENYGELSQAEALIFLDLLAIKAQQQGGIEDVELSARLQAAYDRDQTAEVEIPEIEHQGELEIFLNLVEEKVSQSCTLRDERWKKKAREVYISERDKEITQRLCLIDEAINDFNRSCDRLQKLINESDFQKDLVQDVQQAIADLIRGSHYLLSLAEQYLYPRRNWLQRKLFKQVEFLNFPKFRREERIKTIRYIIDYLERSLSQAEQLNPIQQRRLQQYLKTLLVEMCHLVEWLKEKVSRETR
ncbi:MAG: hypothetical protein AAF383_01155 [Cyanobacteria bacterium P01_A01_bin.83]